jgi:PAS domain-containing protein
MDSLLATHATQQFVEQMPVAFAIFAGEMRYRAVSLCHLSDLAWLFSTEVLPPDEVTGRTFREVSPNMPARWGDGHDRVLAGEEMSRYEDFVLRQDGRPVWVRWIMKPWRDVHGRIGGALLFSELVTEEVEIRHALHDSESRARATFENAAVGIAHLTPDGRFLRFNKALCRILGWPADELITKTVRDITHLADSEARFRATFENAAVGIAHVSSDLSWLRVNQALCRIIGWPIDEFLTKSKSVLDVSHLTISSPNSLLFSKCAMARSITSTWKSASCAKTAGGSGRY